jgi:type I restriction enzyme S subunit
MNKNHKLGDLIESGLANLQTGPFGTMLNASEYVFDGVPVIAVQDIGENKLVYHKFVFVSNDTANRLFRYRVQENDIIFGRKGATDRRALIKENESGWLQGSDCIRLRFNKSINAKFVSYQLGSKLYKEWILQHSTGATMPSLNQEILHLLPLSLPNLLEQNAIADVLSSLDDKIDLLHRQNKTLEQLEETLFRQWFVEEADASWEKVKIGELAELQRGISYSGNSLGEHGRGVPMHNLNSIDINGSYKYQGIKFYTGVIHERQKLNAGDLLIINTDLTQDNRIIGWPVFVPDIFQISTFTHHLYSIKLLNDRLSKFYLYFLLRHRDYREAMASAANGTTVSMLSKEAISNLEIKIPPKNKRITFESISRYLFEKQSKNQAKILTITQLRDTLLPKLMSGEVRIK